MDKVTANFIVDMALIVVLIGIPVCTVCIKCIIGAIKKK